MPPPIFHDNTIEDLVQRTEYESWFLEEVFRIVEENLRPEPLDSLVYPPTGGDGVYTTYGSINIDLGDWRPGFLAVGAPLIFVSTFKLLDMILEWVLVANGHARKKYKFVEKIKALGGSVVFPSLIDSNPWLRDRLIALYEQLEPLRGTIIHHRHFLVIAGALHVSRSKRGSVGPQVVFSENDLRNLSLTLVSILRYLQGAWKLAEFQLKRIRRSLDELAHFHGLPSLGQLPPGYLTTRLYAFDTNPVVVDLDKVRRDVARFRPGQDMMFDIRLILISDDRSTARAVRIPWHQLENAASPVSVSLDGLDALADQVPSDVNIPLIAAALSTGRAT